MEIRGIAAALPEQEAAPEKRVRCFILAEHAPLPDGLEEGDEGVFVVRLVAATRERVEAANVAY